MIVRFRIFATFLPYFDLVTTIKFTSSHANYMYCGLSKEQPEATSFVLQLQMNPEAITEAADSVLDLQSLGFRLLGFAFGFYTHARRQADVGSPPQQLTVVEQPARFTCPKSKCPNRGRMRITDVYRANRQVKLTWTRPQKAQEV